MIVEAAIEAGPRRERKEQDRAAQQKARNVTSAARPGERVIGERAPPSS
jgi:hypothetical protein